MRCGFTVPRIAACALALLGAVSAPVSGAQGCGGEAPLVAHGER